MSSWNRPKEVLRGAWSSDHYSEGQGTSATANWRPAWTTYCDSVEGDGVEEKREKEKEKPYIT